MRVQDLLKLAKSISPLLICRLHDVNFLRMMQVLVANVRCEEIMLERLKQMKSDETWLRLSQKAGTELIAEFGQLASALLSTCLSGNTPNLFYCEKDLQYNDLTDRSSRTRKRTMEFA